MDDKKQKLKNIKDLEYNHALNSQNIILVLVGTFLISVMLMSETSLRNSIQLSKAEAVGLLFMALFISFSYFSSRLKKIKREIRKI